MRHNEYDISKCNYMALPGLLPGTTMFNTKSAHHIIDIVSIHLDVSFKDMFSHHRYSRFVKARQIAMFLLRKHTKRSLKEIGKMFGGRDHTTAIHSINTVNDLCFSNEDYKQELLIIENKLSQC